MNDSIPGNPGDHDNDFDLSGFLDGSDSGEEAEARPKAAEVKPKSVKPPTGKAPVGNPSVGKPHLGKPGPADGKHAARVTKGHRDIQSVPPERSSRPQENRPQGRYGNQDSRGPTGRNSGYAERGGRNDRDERNDRGGFSTRGGSSDRGDRNDRGSGYPNRGGFSNRGPKSIHHIPPRIIERVGGEIHKPASPAIKPYLPLKTDKGRWKESQFLLEGAKNIADVISVGSNIISIVLVSEEFADKDLLALIKKNRIDMLQVTQDDIRALADTESPQGIIAVAHFATLKPDWSLARYVTLLDGVQDPGNVGAILRTSLALGMDAVVVGKGSCDPYNPKVVRSSVGALMRLPFETGEDLGAKMEFLRFKGFSIVATSSHATLTLEQAKLRKKVALIVGNEGAGTGAQYQDMADVVVKIPLKNKVESLNVSVAHGILTHQLIHGRA